MDAVNRLLVLGSRTPQTSTSLMEALTQPSIRVGDSLIRKGQCLKKTRHSAAALAKMLYDRLFKWIVGKCNAAINKQSGMKNGMAVDNTRFIGVLDMAGFEIIARNSFEQLCINYTNERVHNLI